jgi:hypothetical protein
MPVAEQQATPAPPVASEDAAWVTLPTPWPAAELARLCADLEMLWRTNPYYTFRQFAQTGPERFRAEFDNHSNNQTVAVEFERIAGPGSGFTLHYRSGLKRRTLFSIEAAMDGSRLTLLDDYAGWPETERQARLAEVDKSLAAWGEALRIYFLRLKRWSWLPGWRWYLRRVWAPMQPSSRRIVWWIFLISVVEFAFFLFVLLIYRVEQGH